MEPSAATGFRGVFDGLGVQGASQVEHRDKDRALAVATRGEKVLHPVGSLPGAVGIRADSRTGPVLSGSRRGCPEHQRSRIFKPEGTAGRISGPKGRARATCSLCAGLLGKRGCWGRGPGVPSGAAPVTFLSLLPPDENLPPYSMHLLGTGFLFAPANRETLRSQWVEGHSGFGLGARHAG